MRTVATSAVVFLCLTGSALADPCTDLTETAKSALSMQGLDDETRSQLEELLRAGQSGDPAMCEKMTGSVFQSSPEGEKAPSRHRCKDTETTV